MNTKIKNIVYSSHFVKGSETNVNDDYIECNEVYGMLLKAKDLGKKEMIDDAARWLNDIYSQFDITDENGYQIDIRTFIAIFRETMEKLI